ncbi:hypothetical protein D9757_010691 [Collybiopsis confluens]|uniref:Mid2 domain-containing protein n=1 Tax=Collybiopsis confluens TaxID=2823264 RepID=A0A8H5H9R0_9AGAR|nr:hypothetical protein D9757_010691 [Collybiopsis confluens]
MSIFTRLNWIPFSVLFHRALLKALCARIDINLHVTISTPATATWILEDNDPSTFVMFLINDEANNDSDAYGDHAETSITVHSPSGSSSGPVKFTPLVIGRHRLELRDRWDYVLGSTKFFVIDTALSENVPISPAQNTATTGLAPISTSSMNSAHPASESTLSPNIVDIQKTINIGQLVGAIMGGLGFILIIGLVLFCRLRRRRILPLRPRGIVSPFVSRQTGILSPRNKRVMESRQGDASDGPTATPNVPPVANIPGPSVPIQSSSGTLRNIHSILSHTRNSIVERLYNSSQQHSRRNRRIREFRHQDSGWRDLASTRDQTSNSSEVIELPPEYLPV